MVHFCPRCHNMLKLDPEHGLRMFCSTCPYIFNIPQSKIVQVIPMKSKKAVDDVFGGEKAWENVETTAAVCGECSHTRAFYFQIQIRSADEPMTTFFKCASCGHKWREG